MLVAVVMHAMPFAYLNSSSPLAQVDISALSGEARQDNFPLQLQASELDAFSNASRFEIHKH
jgi:hypothetical protein